MIFLFLIDSFIALVVFTFLAAMALFFVKKVKTDRLKMGIGIGFALFTIIFFIFHLLFPWINSIILKPFFIWKVEYILIAIGGTILLTIRYMQCKNFPQKILISVLGGILLILATIPFSLRPFMHLLWSNRKTVTKDDVVLQQSPYSCGAGSLATVLRKRGFKDISEGDAVIALSIVPVLGTEPDCVPPAIRKLTGGKLGGKVKFCSLDELGNIDMPCVSPLKHRGLIGHYVAILKVEDDFVIIGDPLSGIRNLSKSEMRKKWKNTVIELEPIQ